MALPVLPIKTLGVDSSTTNVGFAYYENGELKKTFIRTFAGTYDWEKCRVIGNIVNEVLKKYMPDIVVLEEPINIRNPKGAMALSQVVGAIIMICAYYETFLTGIHNKTVKKLMGIKTKEDSVKKAKEILDKKDMTEHEADAVMCVEAYKILVRE